MIIEKDGQIIVTELRPMSEAPKPTNQKRFSEYFLLFVNVDGNMGPYFTFTDSKNDFYGWFGVFDTEKTSFVGWLPLPIYQPEQKQEPVYLECEE